MNYDNLTICIPAYNEAAAIGETLVNLREGLPGAEIIVVDDGSTDETLTEARKVEGVVVLAHERNIGYGGSLKTAMYRAKGKFIAWCDSDGQHRVEDLKKVVAPVINGEKDAMVGARTKDSPVRFRRMPGKWILKFIAERIVRAKIPDLNSGLRCFRRSVIMRYLHLLPDGFSASTTSTILMFKRGYRMGYVDILAPERIGTSSVRILRDGWGAVQLMVRILVLFEAFGFFTLLSIIQLLPGLIYGIMMACLTGKGIPVLAALMIISGLLTFFMGLICDQIVSLRKERFEENKVHVE